MSTFRLMLDSGAFTVWSRGETVDLDKYIEFCSSYPFTSCYVSLDVIPGKPNDRKSLQKDMVEECCKQGWENYKKMLKTLPLDKVIPVYHENDDIKWLRRYLEFGTPYIGISPANDRTTEQRIQWMKGLRKDLFDGAGRPVCRTHGFAVTSFRLMNFWQWHSVDSASWLRSAAYGNIYIPYKTKGEWDYSRSPLLLATSSKSPQVSERGKHITTLSPLVRQHVLEYLEQEQAALGEEEIIDVPEGHKRQEDELWVNKSKRQVYKISIRGLSNNVHDRRRMNEIFMKRANKVVSVDHIYFAGNTGGDGGVDNPQERRLGRRLLSYVDVQKGAGRTVFENHHQMLIERAQRANES